VKAVRSISWGLLAVVLAVLVGLMTWEPFFASTSPPPPPRAYTAEITRDEFGVPHIHGKTDADVAFGVAWAHAEDDFATLQDVLAMTRGRFGAIGGADGAKVDFALHLLDARGTARRHYGQVPGDVRALLEAYASGLNKYAAAHPAEIKVARLFPVNGEDVATGFALRQPFFFGVEKAIGPLVEGKPPRREHGPVLIGTPAPAYAGGGGDQFESEKPSPLPLGEDAALAGSNAFAVAPKRSGDGVTRLVSNSHQPWWGGTAWYELVVDSDEGWHFAGANFPGSPWPFLGHNDTLGWTNTVNRADLTDIYKLVLDEDGTHYRLDGKWLPFTGKRVWLPVRFGPLVLPVPKTVWRTRHGPALVNARGAFAFRYAGIDDVGQLTTYYRLNRARNYAEWQAALQTRGVPSTNFVYGDKAGNIAFVYNASMPERAAGPDWRGVVPGDDSRLIWRKLAPWSQVPQILNPSSGFLYNSNNTPFMAAGPGSELDPTAYSPLLGIELDVTNRTRRAARLMSATNPIGRLELMRIKYDTGYEREGYVKWMLDAAAALDLRDEPELAKAQKLLAGWDMRADGKGPADALAVMYLQEGMATSYGLKPAPDPRQELANRVAHLKKYFGRIDPPLGEVLRLRQGPGPYRVDLPLDGGGDTLRASTSWKKDAPDGRLPVKHGDSFLMFVEWPAGGGPVTSRSIQPFGAATTRPDSPHFTDQAPLFAAHRTKPVHFTRADIAAHAVRRYVVSNR
jgi:acyl-homoserine-lactone acylase